MIQQLCVFIKNEPKKLGEVTAALAEAGVNMHALFIADSADYGLLRIIVSAPDRAKAALKEAGFVVKINEVVAIALNNKSGSLSDVLKEMEKADISVEYMYAFTSRVKDCDAIAIFSLTDQNAAVEKIKGGNIRFISAGDIAGLE